MKSNNNSKGTLLGHNDLVITILTKLTNQYRNEEINPQKINSINKAINSISKLDYVIKSGSNPKIAGVGPGIAARIDEILLTGTLSELKIIPDEDIASNLCTVSGIGPVKARQLFLEYGITNVDMLREQWLSGKLKVEKNVLTRHIEIGLKYYYDIQQRIPREEVGLIKKMIKEVLPSQYSMTVCGSYRRKMKTCGDIDILITYDRYHEHNLHDIITILKEEGIVIDCLTSDGPTKFMGIATSKINDIGHRLDIRLISKDVKPFAVLYFTGSGEFNKMMRGRALDLGYSLNEYGLKGIPPDIKIHTEKDIFDFLEIKYVKPEDR